jgi:hypothetical protein
VLDTTNRRVVMCAQKLNDNAIAWLLQQPSLNLNRDNRQRPEAAV